jgi:hypothetical protein
MFEMRLPGTMAGLLFISLYATFITSLERTWQSYLTIALISLIIFAIASWCRLKRAKSRFIKDVSTIIAIASGIAGIIFFIAFFTAN